MYLFSFGKSSQKQIKAIQNQAEIKKITKYTYNNEDIPLTSKQKEIFHKLVDERLDEITKSDKKVNSDLIYKYKGATTAEKFNEFDNALDLIYKIREGRISLADAKNDQAKFKSNLGQIKR